ncbi:MAG: HD domain-containing protein, partial [Proteobacteria bacterium]|nr:HD domain-containing protein [Pseudomonadota bacterium]
TDVTKRLADGDLTVRTGQSDASGELGLLALHFDQMAGSLQRREEERKKAEEELWITKFSVDRAVEAVVWIGLDGRFLYVNDAHCRLLNYSRDEMLSMDILDIFDVDPRSSGEDWPEFWSKHKQEKTSYFESLCRTKDGMLIPVEINANYLSYEDKEFIVGFCRDISQRKLSEERLKRQIDRLAALRAIDMAITASLDMRVTFSIFLEQVINNLHVDAADVLVLNSHSFNKLTFVAGRGFRTNALRYTNLSIGEGFAGRVAQERKTICIPDLEKEAQDLLKISPQISSEDFVAYYGAPLIAKGQVKGVLEIFNRTPLEPDQEWLDFLEALATQAAIAADNAMLFDDLQKSNLDLLQAYDSTLEGWSNALDLRDRETEGHSQRVTEMTLRMARQMGMRDSELAHVRRGALLHDIGKMGIPDGILLKPGPLDDEEWEIMRKHPVYAYELLYPITYLRPAVDIPYSHHEKWDGTGYPRGLKGVHIPLAARIFAIVDVWDALRSDRPYRPAWPEEKTREHIKEQTGKQFDPKVVEVFLELLNEFKPV